MGVVINVVVSGQQMRESAVQRCGSALAFVSTVPLLREPRAGFYRGSYGVIVCPACCKPETGNPKVTIFDVLVPDASPCSGLTSRLLQCGYCTIVCA